MPLQFRRGTDAERLTITPAVGEPIWTTNTNRIYVGDGTTVGGVAVDIPLPSTGTFVSLTLTNLHFTGDPVGVNQTTAWTGTVVWSAISSKPNGGLYTTSTVEFEQLSVTGSAIPSTEASVLINASGTSTYELPHAGGYGLWAINKVGSSARIVTDAYTAASAGAGSVWTGRKARGTASAPTAALNGDLLLRVAGTGFGDTEFENTSSSYIDFKAIEDFTDGAHGTSITLNTTNSGTNTVNASLTVRSDGTIITAPQGSATSSVLLINKTGLASYQTPSNVDGFDIWAIRDQESARAVMESYGTGVFPAWQGRRARGTAASPTAVQTDDTLVSLRANGYGATEYSQTSTGYVNISAIENFTDTDRGTRILFGVTPAGSIKPDTVATMRSDGVFVYTTATTGNGMLTVQGSYPNLTFELAYDGTNIQTVNIPNTAGRILVDTYAADNAGGYGIDKSYFTGRRARGTASAPTAVQVGDSLARFNGIGYADTGFINTSSAGITFVALENFTDSAAGGKISFDVMPIGATNTSSQTVAMTLTAADGATVDQLNVNNLTINNIGEILTTTTSTDIDLYTNSAGGNYSEVWIKHDDGVEINTNGAAQNWKFNKTGILTFPDSTNQNTAWTGTVANSQITSVSTSKVTGLSVVGWTNNYNDLTAGPNQLLSTSSNVTFANIQSSGNLGGVDLSASKTLYVATTASFAAVVDIQGGVKSPVNLYGFTTATSIMTISQTTATALIGAGDNWQTVDLTVTPGSSIRLITSAAANHTIRADTSSTGAGVTIFKIRRKITDQPFSGLNGFGGSLTWNLTDNTNTNTDFLRWNGLWSTTGVHNMALQTSNNDFSTNTRLVNFTTQRMQAGATAGTSRFTMTNSVSSSPSIELGAGSTATIAVTGPMSFAVYTVVGKPASGAVGSTICISNSTPGGRLAYWDTTNVRWSYVADDSAV